MQDKIQLFVHTTPTCIPSFSFLSEYVCSKVAIGDLFKKTRCPCSFSVGAWRMGTLHRQNGYRFERSCLASYICSRSSTIVILFFRGVDCVRMCFLPYVTQLVNGSIYRFTSNRLIVDDFAFLNEISHEFLSHLINASMS